MSVDDRLREAFGGTDRTWDDQAPAALTALTARHRRESAVRRGAGAALVAAAAIAAVGVTVSHSSDEQPAPSDGPTPPTTSTTGPADVPASLDGNWLSGRVTGADVRRAAREAGSPGKAALMLAGLPDTPFRVALVIVGDRHETILSVRSGGKTDVFDQENIEMRGDRLALTPRFAEGENVHTWVVKSGVLRMDFVSSTEPDTALGPAEAWQRLFYDTVAFTRGG